jgi:hypothetical protein
VNDVAVLIRCNRGAAERITSGLSVRGKASKRMVIEKLNGEFVIRRGVNYFSFFVDSSGSSWTSRLAGARKFKFQPEARSDLTELRKRAAFVARSRRERVSKERK